MVVVDRLVTGLDVESVGERLMKGVDPTPNAVPDLGDRDIRAVRPQGQGGGQSGQPAADDNRLLLCGGLGP